MKKRVLMSLALFALFCVSGFDARSQCNPDNVKTYINNDGTLAVSDKLIIDARLDEINSFRGKTAFKNQAELVVTNMNPFMFRYKILVEQEEIKDEAFLDFLKLLGAPVSDVIGKSSAIRQIELDKLASGGNLEILKTRTAIKPDVSNKCGADAEEATRELAAVRKKVLDLADEIKEELNTESGNYQNAQEAYEKRKGTIFSTSVEAQTLCRSANELFQGLTKIVNGEVQGNYPLISAIEALLNKIQQLNSLSNELRNSATEFTSEYTDCKARSKGLSYAGNLIRLADEIDTLSASYEGKVTELKDETIRYDSLVNFIKTLNGREAKLLQRELTVFGQYDISALQIKVVPELLNPDGTTEPKAPTIGNVQAAQQSGDTTGVRNGSLARAFAPSSAATFTSQNEGSSGGAGAGQQSENKEIKARATIGARRFELSGGLAFASLARREFKPVLGFARNAEGQIVDANGNPTDKRDFSQIVGLTENSKRRIAPVVLLHTRLTNNPTYNMFFSFGITGKSNGGNFDLEYLVGPSFNFKNMFFTFGGYAGKQQRLAGDLFLGAKLSDSADDVPVINEYKWKPGFSFTYRIPVGGGPKTPQ
jgi:hypothetical protein